MSASHLGGEVDTGLWVRKVCYESQALITGASNSKKTLHVVLAASKHILPGEGMTQLEYEYIYV